MPIKALVVDDEPDLELLVKQTFRAKIRSGEYLFVFARNGEEALHIFENDKEIGIVMADINMPVMDGLTLLARMGDARRVHRTVIVSAYDDLRNIRTAMNRGAYDFLTKPIDFADFEATLLKAAHEVEMLQQGQSAREELAGLRRELSIARSIQESMLPASSPLAADSPLQAYASMFPATEVGGDLYDYFLIDEHRFGFAVGDVSGKGVPAALYMAVTCSLLRATAMRSAGPEQCLTYMNKVLVSRSPEDMYVTLLYGEIDIRTGEVCYCTAGHVPPLLLTPGEKPQALREARGMMLGMFEEATFGTAQFRLQPSQTLLVYTDGISEAANPEGHFLTLQGFLRIVQSGPADPKLALDHALLEVRQFEGDTPQSDDITLMAIQWKP